MKSFVLLLACAAGLVAQPTQNVLVNPDCMLPFTMITVGTTIPLSGGFNNRQIGCNVWQIQYSSSGFTALSLALEAAPDNFGMPGTWATMTATAIFGVNPNTSTVGASTLLNAFGAPFPAWVRVRLVSATGIGNVVGIAVGFRQASAQVGAPAISGTLTANITQVGGVPVPTTDGTTPTSLWNGTTWNKAFVCDHQDGFAIGGGLNEIIPAGPGIARICHVSLSATVPFNLQFLQGTGSDCDTNTTDIIGPLGAISSRGIYYSIQSLALDFSSGAALRSLPDQAVCILARGAGPGQPPPDPNLAIGGLVVYARF